MLLATRPVDGARSSWRSARKLAADARVRTRLSESLMTSSHRVVQPSYVTFTRVLAPVPVNLVILARYHAPRYHASTLLVFCAISRANTSGI